MARRRMFSMELVSSDRFLGLAPTAQSFYFHLGVHADDEGFVSAPNSLALLCKGSQADLQELEDSGFIIRFASGVLVIVDWLIHNTIRKDRSMETLHRAEKAMLDIVEGKYVLKTTTTAEMATNVTTKNDIFFSDNSAPQNRTEKNRKENNRIDHNSIDQSPGSENRHRGEDEKTYDENTYPKLWDIFNYCTDNNLKNVDSVYFWSHYNSRKWLDDQGNPIRDWRALMRKWNASPLHGTVF